MKFYLHNIFNPETPGDGPTNWTDTAEDPMHVAEETIFTVKLV